MKYLVKVLIVIDILFLILTHTTVQTKRTYADITYYAKIINEQTSIYSLPDDNAELFILPESYYVELISAYNNNYYYAKYRDIYGYVKKKEVKVVNGIPQKPYLIDITFRVFVPSGANLRSTPNNNGSINLIYSIPFLDSNLSYYGIINGEEAISKKGTVWYYCKYFANNISYMGYVYSPLCDSLSAIEKNNESLEYIEGEINFNQDTIEPTQINAIESLPQTLQTIIIIAISLPCLLFIYLLFKPTMVAEEAKRDNTKNSHKKRKKKITRLKHSDYFELHDDF